MPLAPSLTTARLGTVWPAAQFRSEAVGRPFPSGHTVRYPAAVVSVIVTFSTTAVGGAAEVMAGTPPSVATGTVMVPPGPTGPFAVRVSRMRLGLRPLKATPVALGLLAASTNQPLTSATTSVLPVRL